MAVVDNVKAEGIHIGTTYALPYLEHGVGGTGVHVEYRTDRNLYYGISAVNMRYADKWVIGPQASIMAGKQWESKKFLGMRVIGRLGVEATTNNSDAVSSHFRINTALGIKFLGITCMHFHGSVTRLGGPRINHGEDRGICMVRKLL